MKAKVKHISKSTRRWRRLHQYLGISLAILLLISAVTGLLLGWKKDVAFLQPPTQKGQSPELSHWMTMQTLSDKAGQAMQNYDSSAVLDRIDVRPDKGILKFQYVPGYWEVQVDGTTGEILSVEKRYSDLIEQIHDGSIIHDFFKLISMNILGIGLTLMILSGFWLWYGPRKIRKIKHTKGS
jgi:uncharacterized iron-regulated membrane protein